MSAVRQWQGWRNLTHNRSNPSSSATSTLRHVFPIKAFLSFLRARSSSDGVEVSSRAERVVLEVIMSFKELLLLSMQRLQSSQLCPEIRRLSEMFSCHVTFVNFLAVESAATCCNPIKAYTVDKSFDWSPARIPAIAYS